MSSTGKRSYFTALDGFRAIAFLLVFFFHYDGLPWGWAGVDLFFVLSGFLITGILYDARFSDNRYYNFYLRRTLRIFPLYYGIFALLLLLTPLLHWNWNALWLAWPLYVGNYLRLLPGINPDTYTVLVTQGANLRHHFGLTVEPFWSLCVEEQFYLVWPCIVFSIKDRRRLMWICGLCVLIIPILRAIADHTLPAALLAHRITYYVTPFRVDALLLGGLVALWLRGPRADVLHRLAPRVAAGLVGLGVVGAAVSVYYHHKIVTPPWAYTWGTLLIDIFGAAIVLLCLDPGGMVYRAMNVAWLRWMGRISYGLYVYHALMHDFSQQIALRLVTRFVGPVTALIGLTLTILVSWVSFTFFESSFLKLKERLTRRPASEAAPSSEFAAPGTGA